MIDGRTCSLVEARLPLADEGVARGDGAFETVGVWDGRPFRLGDHLARLTRSLIAIALQEPDAALLSAEAAALLAEVEPRDAMLRIAVTASGTRVLTVAPQPDRPPLRHLAVQPAPWIRPLGTYAPAGAKTLSYCANMAATRAAVAAGADDALLVATEGHVLEGPTFGVVWVRDATVYAAARSLGIVASLSRDTVLAAARADGLRVDEGVFDLAALQAADEVGVSSSVRPLQRLARVDDATWTPAAATVLTRLAAALDDARRGRRDLGAAS